MTKVQIASVGGPTLENVHILQQPQLSCASWNSDSILKSMQGLPLYPIATEQEFCEQLKNRAQYLNLCSRMIKIPLNRAIGGAASVANVTEACWMAEQWLKPAGWYALIGAILIEVCTEADGGFGIWEAISKKANKARWGSGGQPIIDDWLQILQRFKAAACVTLLEVQCSDFDDVVPGSKRRKLSGGVGDVERILSTIVVSPGPAAIVKLVTRGNGVPERFPIYRLKPSEFWPTGEFFNLVRKRILYRKQFNGRC